MPFTRPSMNARLPGKVVRLSSTSVQRVEAHTIQRELSLCPNATIYAFEPQPKQAEKLRERFKENERIYIFENAVGDVETYRTLNIAERNASSSLLPVTDFGLMAAPFASAKQQIEVSTVSLDHWYMRLEDPPSTIDLIKIDTQGFEKYVISGGGSVLQKTRYVILEAAFRPVYEGQALYEDLVLMMKDHLFSIQAVGAGYFNRASGDLIEVDILFEKREGVDLS
ncbi:MAG: FkbM family methyltransferase [Chloroflexota bacterium]